MSCIGEWNKYFLELSDCCLKLNTCNVVVNVSGTGWGTISLQSQSSTNEWCLSHMWYSNRYSQSVLSYVMSCSLPGFSVAESSWFLHLTISVVDPFLFLPGGSDIRNRLAILSRSPRPLFSILWTTVACIIF